MRRRDGGLYYYHRKTGKRLPDAYGSPEFARAWAEQEALARAPAAKGPPSGSYAALVDAFKASPEWARLSDLTRRDYSRVVMWMSGQGADHRPARDLRQARCQALVDKAARDHRYRFGQLVGQFNRRLWNWVLKREDRRKLFGEDNPWTHVELPERPRGLAKRHPAWRPEHVATVLSRAPLGLARAYVLAASGCAGGDIVARTWAEYADGEFEPLDRAKTGVTGYPSVPALLRPWLDNGPRPSTHVATNAHGRPFASPSSFQTCSSKFLRGLAAEGEIPPGLNPHGLRHTIATALAESGAKLRGIQGALQHKTARMALHYSEQADKRKLAREGVAGLDPWFGDSLQNVIPIDCKAKRSKG